MYFSIQTKMHIELRKKFIQVYSQFDKEVDFNFLNEKLAFDEKKARFHFTAFDSPNKTTIKNNIVFVWTRQMKICGYFCEQLLGEKRNVMLMGEKSTGKSSLLKNISYPIYSCRYKMQAAYKKMLLTITGENFKQKNLLIVQVEDFHLEVNQNAGECLKYLWETNLFYNTKTSFIDSLQSFNLVLEHENQGPLLPTFRHLYPITFQPLTHSTFESIYSHKIITHINQSLCINIANIDNYPDVMSRLSFRRYLEGIKVISDFFLPTSRKEWIHLYREKLFNDAVEMFCEAVPLTRQTVWNEPPNEKTTEYKDMLSSLISQILAHITKNLLHLLYLRLSNQEYLELHTLINKSIFVLRTNQGETDRMIPVQEKKAIEKAVYGALTYHDIKITDILTRNIDKICQIFEIPLKKLVFVNCLYWHPIGYLLDFVIESMMKDKNQILVVKSEFENFDAYVTFMDGFIDRQEWKIKHQTIKPIITSLKTPKTPKKTLFYLYYPAHTLLSTKNLLNYIQEYQMIQETEQIEIIHIVEYVEDDENFIAQMMKENGRLVDESLIVVLEREGKKERKEKVHEILSRNRELVEKNPHLPDTLCNVYQQLEEGIKQLESQNPISSVFDRKQSFYEWFGYKSITPLDTIMTVDVFSHTLRLFSKKYSSTVRVLSQRWQLLRQGNLVIDKLIKQEQQKSKQLKELQINLNKYYTEEKLYMKELKDLNDQIQSFDNSNDKVKIAQIKENIRRKNNQISAYIKQRSQLLTSSQTLHSSITRTQLSQYKYIFTNNFANYADLFSGLSLALSGDEDYETIHKNINDVNLMTKIKDLSMKKMKFQTVKLINIKIKAQKNILSEDRKGIRNLMEWLYCASEYEIYCREEAQTIFKLKKQINENQNTIRLIEQEYKIPQKLKIKESKQEYIEGKKNKMHELENSVGKIEKILQKIQDLQELTKLKQFSCTWINKISMKISLLLPISLYIAFSQTILLRLQGQQFSIMKKQIKNTIMREFKVSEDFEKYIGLEEYIQDHEQGGQNLEQTEIHNKIKARLLKNSKENMSTCAQLYRTVSDHIKEGIISHRSPIFTQFRLTKNKLIKLLTFISLVKVFVEKEKKMIGTKGSDLQPIIVIDKEGTFTDKLEELVKFYEGVESERSCGDVVADCKNAWKNCMFIKINADEWSISEEKQIVQQYYKQKEKIYWIGDRKVIVPEDTLPIFLKTQPPTQNINPYDQPYAFSHFKIINFGTDTEDEEESLLLQLEESIYNEMEQKKIRVAATKEILECQCLKLYEILQVVRSVSIEDSNILSMLMKDTLNWLEVKKTHQQNRIKCEEQTERSELLIEKIASRLLTLYKTYKQAQIIKYHKLSNTYTFTQFLHLISSCGKYLPTDLLDEEKYYQYYEEIYKIVLYQFMHEKCGRQFQILYYIKYKNDEMFEQNNYHKFNNLLFESGWFKTLKTILNFRGMLYEGAILKELVLDHKSLTKKIQNLIGSLGERAEISETEVMSILMHPSFTSIQQFQLLKLFMPHLFSSLFHDHLQSSPSYLEDFHSVNKTLTEYFSKHILLCYCNVQKWTYYLTKSRNIERHQRRAGCLGSIFFHDMNDKIKYKIEIVTYTEDDQLSKFVNRLRLQIKKEKFIVILIEENKYHWTHDEFKSQTISVGKLLKLFWESFIKNGHLFAEYNNFRNLKLFENQYTYEELEEQFIQYKHFEELILNKFEVKNIWDEKNISHFVQKINNSSAYVSEFFSSLSNLTNSEITILEIKKIMEECRLKLHETLKDQSAPQLELVSQALSSNTQINTPIHSYIREYRNKIEEQFQKIRQKSRFHTKMEKLEVYRHLPQIRLELRKLLKLLGSYLRFRRDEKAADDEVELGLIIGFSKTQEKEKINRTRKKKKGLRSESMTKRTRFRANSIQKLKIKQ